MTSFQKSFGQSRSSSTGRGMPWLAVAIVACFAACSKGDGSGPSANETSDGVCSDECIKPCDLDSECNAAGGELCCDYGIDGNACAAAKECPRQCTLDTKCDTANGEACVRRTLLTPILVCDKPSDGLRLCQADLDCKEPGDVCCAAYKEPVCLPADRCPKRCSNSTVCNNTVGEICCTTLPTVDTTLVAGGICIVPSKVDCPTACTKSTDCRTNEGELCCNGLCSTSCVQACKTSADCSAQVCCKTKASRSPFVRKYENREPGYDVVSTPTNTGGSGSGGSGSGGSGSGGSGSGSGGAGTGGSGGTIGGTGVIIRPNNGYVDGSTNGVGIRGYFYTFADAFSTISPTAFSNAGLMICIKGSVAAVVNMNYTAHWGAGLGLNLNQERDGGKAPMPYDPAANKVTGFTFSLAGPAVPAALQISYKLVGSDTSYCKKVGGAGTHNASLAEVRANCGSLTPGPALPAGPIAAVQIVIPSQLLAVPFDFCLSGGSATTN